MQCKLVAGMCVRFTYAQVHAGTPLRIQPKANQATYSHHKLLMRLTQHWKAYVRSCCIVLLCAAHAHRNQNPAFAQAAKRNVKTRAGTTPLT